MNSSGPRSHPWGTPEIPPGWRSGRCDTAVWCLSPDLPHSCIYDCAHAPTKKQHMVRKHVRSHKYSVVPESKIIEKFAQMTNMLNFFVYDNHRVVEGPLDTWKASTAICDFVNRPWSSWYVGRFVGRSGGLVLRFGGEQPEGWSMGWFCAELVCGKMWVGWCRAESIDCGVEPMFPVGAWVLT